MLLYTVFTPALSIYTDTWHVTLDIWFMTPALGIYTGTRYLHRYLVFTPILGKLHLIYELWLRHSVFTLVLSICTGTWYLKPVPRHLIFRHRYSIYVILDTWSWYPVYDMLSCGTSTLTWHCDPWPDTTTLDTCIIWHIHDYHFYGDLVWLLYYYQIFGTTEFLYSWTPVYLNPWNRGILTLLLILYSCWPP